MDASGARRPGRIAEELEAALAEGFGLLDLMTAAGPVDARRFNRLQARVDVVLSTLSRAEQLFGELCFDPPASLLEPPSASQAARSTRAMHRCRSSRRPPR